MKLKLVLTLLLGAAMTHAQVPGPQIPLTGKIGAGGIFPLINAGTINFTADANLTMSYPQMSALVLKVTSGVSLTTTRNLIAPMSLGFEFIVENATTGGQAIQVIGTSGTGVTIANGSTVIVVCDGTNYVSAGSSGGGGAVDSVFTRTGNVTAQTGDYTVSQVTGAAPIASPTFTGTPAAPTPATSDNSTELATTAYTRAYIASLSYVTGSGTSGHCAQWGASNTLGDAGAACGTSSGINQLTGDVLAGPGTGSQAATLATSGVTAGTYGDATHSVTIAFDAKGRATSASSVAITAAPSGTAGGDLAGSYPNPTIATVNSNTGSFGDATHTVTTTVNAKGQTTAISSVAIPTGAAGTNGLTSPDNTTITAASGVLSVNQAYTYNWTGNHTHTLPLSGFDTWIIQGATVATISASGINTTLIKAAKSGLTSISSVVYPIPPSLTPPIDYANASFQTELLAGNTAPTLVAPGQANPLLTFRLCQPGGGGPFTWTWPTGMSGGMNVASIPAGQCGIQTFFSWDQSTYEALTPGVVNGVPMGPPHVVYTSSIPGATGGCIVTPGSSAASCTDSSSAINAVLAGGNIDLEVNSGYAANIVAGSNTRIHCTSPQFGFIAPVASNKPVLSNLHQNAPTTSNGTGGYLVSNQTDKNLTFEGCQWDANATEAVTGTNGNGVPHSVDGSGLMVAGVQMLGVNGLNFTDNTVYDSGGFVGLASNVSNAHVDRNTFLQPLPLVQLKNTDGWHWVGPWQDIWEESNNITAGDDSIPLNVDDGNENGDAEFQIPNLKWGNGIDAHIAHNTVSSSFGVRLLSGASLLDGVTITDTRGSACGQTFTAVPYGSLGNGNIGDVSVNGWHVQTDGTCNVYSSPYNFNFALNARSVTIGDVSYVNPAVNWPLVTLTSGGGTVGILNLHDINLTTSSSTFSSVVVTNASAGQIRMANIGWRDTVGSPSFLSGSVVPNTITCSNYAGPNVFLASGYVPTHENGDCFTNNYATVYVNSTFNEHASGALASTTPATCANGCTGTWTAAANQPSSGAYAYTTNSATLSGGCTSGYVCPVYIDTGHANYTLRVNITTPAPDQNMIFFVRYTDSSNFSDFEYRGGTSWFLCDVVAGTQTCGSGVAFGAPAGLYTIVANGTTLSLTNPAGTISGTVSGSNVSATRVATPNDYTSVSGSLVISSFNVASN